MPEVSQTRQSPRRWDPALPGRVVCEWLRTAITAAGRDDTTSFEAARAGLAKAGWRLERIPESED